MCRWIAYSGTPIYLHEALFNAEHSLIHQSLRAKSSETTTNGDGFGIGWYNDRSFPGVFKDVRPANTMVQVGRFIDPLWLVEIEADAIVSDLPH